MSSSDSSSFSSSDDSSFSLSSSSCRQFSLDEIKEATNNFDEKKVLGHGGEGKVYLAEIYLESKFKKAPVAVKHLNKDSTEFENEIRIVSKIKHPNLVCLLGYCKESDEKILIYEYMEKGSLSDYVKMDSIVCLSWKQRLSICLGAAYGLQHLHKKTNEFRKGIIHRDVKPANILLDQNWVAKVSDFGMFKLSNAVQINSTIITDIIKGTRGYFAPEYAMSYHITRKIDVYSFGVVMFEVLCRKKPWDRGDVSCYLEENEDLGDWALENIDSKIKADISYDSLKEFTDAIGRSLRSDPSRRPTMDGVVLALETALKRQEHEDERILGIVFKAPRSQVMELSQPPPPPRTLPMPPPPPPPPPPPRPRAPWSVLATQQAPKLPPSQISPMPSPPPPLQTSPMPPLPPPPPPPPPPPSTPRSVLVPQQAPKIPPPRTFPMLPPGAPERASSGSLISGRAQGTRSSVPPTKASLKAFHWLKSSRIIEGSIWADSLIHEKESSAPEFDMSELESLFSTASSLDGPGKGGVRRNSKVNEQHKKVQLVDLRRANNCEIMLSRIKIPLPDFLNAIFSWDASALEIDDIENVIKFGPTEEEKEMLKNYTGDKEMLGKCEQFFMELIKVTRLESKLRVLCFTMTFSDGVKYLRMNLTTVNNATTEVKESTKLRQIMQIILTLGNALNQGTARGSAQGFRLDSLLKLSDTRARNSKMTLMHFLCKHLTEKMPQLLDFDKDLVHLEAASKIQIKSLAEEMQAVSKGVEKVEQELNASDNKDDISASFQKVMMSFLSTAEAEVKSLISFYFEVGRNLDTLATYFGEDPARYPFEQVTGTLVNFSRMFKNALRENERQAALVKEKLEGTSKGNAGS